MGTKEIETFYPRKMFRSVSTIEDGQKISGRFALKTAKYLSKVFLFFFFCFFFLSILYSRLYTFAFFMGAFLFSLSKHAYSNILKILQPKKENFQIKEI